MTGLLAILVVALPLFGYWLFRRRTDNRADRQREERSPAPDRIIVDRGRTAVLEVEATPNRQSPQQQEVEAGGDVTGKTERGHPGGAEPAASPRTELEQDNLTYPEVEGLVIKECIGKPVPDGVAERADQLLFVELGQSISIPLSKPFQDEGSAAAVIELPHFKGSGSAEEAKGDVINAATVPDQQLQADGPMAECAGSSVPFHTEEPPQTNGSSGDVGLPEPAEEHFDDGTQKTLSRYRPPVQKPPRPAPTPPVDRTTARGSSSEVTLEIRVRLTLDRFYFCTVTFLPGRTAELNDDVVVKLDTASLQLVAQEDWYQDLSFSETGRYLRDGFELKGVLSDQRQARWLLKGRDVYVLAFHPRANGFVSATRLLLGRSHVVLCVSNLVGEVETVLKEAGCQGYSKLDETQGLPDGWAGFRGVSPTSAIAVETGISDPFYAIKPASDIEIEFEAGVRLRNSVWLAGYPPKIKLFGQPGAGIKALIDGKEALPAEDGSLVVDGYGLPGSHSVYCGGVSRSYSVEEPPDSWEAWPAYQFGEAKICGALVQLPPEEAGRPAFTVPMSNPLLIGAEPGQVFRCSARSVALWRGFVPFDVVWALPAQPLTCNKKFARILQFADKPLMPLRAGIRPLVWCSAILDASRKGLRIEGGSAQSAERWSEYKKTARNIWRGRR